MMTLVKVMSLLVASGNGDRCNSIRSNLRDLLLSVDEATGELKINIHKFGKDKYPIDYSRVCKEVSKTISPYLRGVSIRYYGNDKKYLSAITLGTKK